MMTMPSPKTLGILFFAALTCVVGLTTHAPEVEAQHPGNNPVVQTRPVRPVLVTCTSGKLPKAKDRDWNHRRSKLVTATGKPVHTARDVLTTSEHGVIINGKFAYGKASKDLEDESIEVLIDDCGKGYKSLGKATTDGDGRVAFHLARKDLPKMGFYNIVLRVEGDGTTVPLTLSIYPPGTQVVVFDIDGTLTTADVEALEDAVADFFEPIYKQEVVPEKRPSAVEITKARHLQGYAVVYLTGRPYNLTRITRQWLKSQGFAPGSLRLTYESAQVLPVEAGVGEFKHNELAGLKAKGFQIGAAYGNAETDIYAYQKAGIPNDRIFIVGKHGGKKDTEKLGEGYTKHIKEAEREPNVRRSISF